MKNFLSDDERNRLILEHKKERNKPICDRAILLYDKGWILMQIAEATFAFRGCYSPVY